MARWKTTSTRLPISFHEARRQSGARHFYFQLARQAEPGRLSHGYLHLRRRANLRAGVAALLGFISYTGEAPRGRRRVLSAIRRDVRTHRDHYRHFRIRHRTLAAQESAGLRFTLKDFRLVTPQPEELHHVGRRQTYL